MWGLHPNPPKIRFTTMILSKNLDELAELALHCHKEHQVLTHEFRTPFFYGESVHKVPGDLLITNE